MAPQLRTAAATAVIALGLVTPARAQYPPPPLKSAPAAAASPQFAPAATPQQYYLLAAPTAPSPPPPSPVPAGAHALTWGRPGPLDRALGALGRRLYERGLPRLRLADPSVIQAVIVPGPAPVTPSPSAPIFVQAPVPAREAAPPPPPVVPSAQR